MCKVAVADGWGEGFGILSIQAYQLQPIYINSF